MIGQNDILIKPLQHAVYEYSFGGRKTHKCMSTVYERPFEVVKVSEKDFSKENKCSLKIL